jgi:hypothetical protein
MGEGVTPGSRSDESPAAVARRIDQACDRFEKDWRAGAAPRIEEFVAELPPGEASALLKELVALEVELRRAAGEGPEAGE